ncbi:MAG: ribonuclease III [Acidimicrobiia bacterium]
MPQHSVPDIEGLCDRLGYRFTDDAILRQALAHRSFCAETPGTQSNERLEFLGDAVLGMVVADLVYRTYPDLDEGHLTDGRKAVVNAAALAEVAVSLDLGSDLLLGKGEAAAGGRHKVSILSDALEAVFGAVFLDGGWDAAYELIARLLRNRIGLAVGGVSGLDYKTLLQEMSARRFERPPVYRVSEQGPDHNKLFTAIVSLDGVDHGHGEGRSKKQAEQAAARVTLEKLMPAPAESAEP